MRKEDIKELAVDLLRKKKIKAPPVPVEQIIDGLGIGIRYAPFEGKGDVSGLLYREPDRTIIGINSLHYPTRQRFTLAHELGHFLLHKKSKIFVDKASVHLRDTVSSLALDPKEIEANQFAAEILMPEDMVRAVLKDGKIDIEDEEGINELADHFEVSPQAMMFRLTNLGLITAV